MKITYCVIFIAVFAIVSCKKTDDYNPQDFVIKKIASLNQTSSNADYNVGLTNFEYYPDGKLKKIDQINKRIIEYEYSENSVVEKTTRYNESSSSTTTYSLNSKGLAISANSSGSSFLLEYDSQGYLLQEKDSFLNYVDCLTSKINNGNVSSVAYSQNGTTQWTMSFEYYSKKSCTFNCNQTGNNFHWTVGLDFLGKRSVNLVKRYVVNDKLLNYPIAYDCSYIFDTNGDVTRVTINITGGVVVCVDYTYV